MSWWILKVQRAVDEVESIQQLEKESDWLSLIGSPTFDGSEFIYNFDLVWHGVTYPLRLRYPEFFPDVPARIVHREGKLISIHQYGKFGELCLKHRAENWNSDVTGRSMIEDAYALISGEHPIDGAEGLVPSGDLLTQGQQHHQSKTRFIQPFNAPLYHGKLQPGEACPILFLHSSIPDGFKLRVKAFEKSGDGEWVSITPTAPGETELEGMAVNFGKSPIKFTSPMKEISRQLIADFKNHDLSFMGSSNYRTFFVDVSTETWAAYANYNQDKSPLPFSTIQAPSPSDRLPESYKQLSEKHVAVIGCGSIGSKVAVSLARSGVRKFTLIDDDIFHEDNCVRNELDCLSAGLHKVDAVKQSIERLPGNFEIVVKRAGLGRQNSAFRTNDLMESVSKTDLIIDLTASPRAFNYAATVSARRMIPFIGCSVFSGGIGGLLFRSRPNIDPTPAKAKAQIRNWRDTRPVKWEEDDPGDP